MRVKIPDNVIVYIYELRDPRDKEYNPKYVGITIAPLNVRLRGHLEGKKLRTNTYKNNWVKQLSREGLIPTIHLIEEVVGWTLACEREKYWIAGLRKQGFNLTNSTDGGEGSVGIIAREETRKKLSIATTGENNPAYGKFGKDSPAYGLKHSEETVRNRKASIKQAILNRGCSEDAGITYDSKRDRWVATIWIFGKKWNIGTYGDRDYAIMVKKEIYAMANKEVPNTKEEIQEVINKHVQIEYCKKLPFREPDVRFHMRGKWLARMSVNGTRYHLGLFVYKQQAINAWKKENKRLFEEMSNNLGISNFVTI